MLYPRCSIFLDTMTKADIVVIGGGAAGCFAAIHAAESAPSRKVIVLEKSSKLLSKVRISGGGRCNLTHNCNSIPEMVKRYPRGARLLKKTFHRFFTNDTIEWFSRQGVRVKAEADGRMFPDTDDSQTVIDALLRAASDNRVEFRLNSGVGAISKEGDHFLLEISNGEKLQARKVIVACGGYPKSSMFDWLRSTGHTITPPVPSLFTFNMPKNPITELMGVSVTDAAVRIAGTKLSERGPVLVTHWGLSGPAVLRLSAWGARELEAMNYRFSVMVNWVPEFHENSLREKMRQWRFERAAQKIANRNPLQLPQRLWEYLLHRSGVNPDIRWADLPAKEQNLLIRNCTGEIHSVEGKTTFKDEFVTCGGIDLSEIDSETLMSKKLEGLYFAGEIMDVDGITGGFNFQHAWTSGFITGKEAAKALGEG